MVPSILLAKLHLLQNSKFTEKNNVFIFYGTNNFGTKERL